VKKYIFLSFIFMGWAFYELSGGSDFEPQTLPAAEPVASASIERATPATDDRTNVPRVVQVSTARAEIAPEKPDAVAEAVAEALETTPELAASLQDDSGEEPAVQLVSLSQSGTLFAQPIERLEVVDPAPSQAASETVRDIRWITGSRVNMRNGPGTQYSILDKLVEGDEVEVLDDLGNGWVKLRTINEGRVGWMADFLLSDPTG
jgi:hypothetical protein